MQAVHRVPRLTEVEAVRFNLKILRRGRRQCWPWLGGVSRGYGKFTLRNRCMQAHRVSYTFHTGDPVPLTMTIDHLCRNTVCMNPAHMEIVTGLVNTLRGGNPMAHNARKAFCVRGHALMGDNVRVYGRSRHCLACRSIRSRQDYLAKKARVVTEMKGAPAK